MKIRDYQTSDWPEVCRIHDQARVQELVWGGVDPAAFLPMATVAERDEFFASRTLVAELDGRVMGFISWSGNYITWLYVDPAAQRRSIGRNLLNQALAQIGSEMWTNCLAGDSPAIALYESAGMHVVQSRRTTCEGQPCTGLRLALPTSRMSDPAAKRYP